MSISRTHDDEIYIEDFHGLNIIADSEFGIDYPSRLPVSYLVA